MSSCDNEMDVLGGFLFLSYRITIKPFYERKRFTEFMVPESWSL